MVGTSGGRECVAEEEVRLGGQPRVQHWLEWKRKLARECRISKIL